MSAWVLDTIYGSLVSDMSLRVPAAVRKLYKAVGILLMIGRILIVGRIAY